jgi:Tol biopolymer transport system component
LIAAAPPPSPPGIVVFDDISLDGQRTFIVRERADGTRVVRITRNGNWWWPVWSPDGRQVAAFNGRGIGVLTPGGRVVRHVQALGSTAYLTWSPDERWFAYVAEHCNPPGSHEDPSCGTLWVVRVDGTGQRRASREGAVALVYSFEKPYDWSPDGRRLVYATIKGLVVYDLLTGRRHLLGPSAHLEASPDWSPDGTRLLYGYGSELVTSAPDGTRRRLVRGAHDSLLAAWSPDGRRIAYIQGLNVFVARPDGSARVRIGGGLAESPLIWSRDGTHLLVGVGGGDRFEILAADGRARPRHIRGGDKGDWNG